MIGALLLALLAPLEPLPLIAFIVVLSSRHGRSGALGFTGGWIVSAVIIAVAVWATAGSAPASEGSTPIAWVGALQVALGLGLVVLGVRRRNSGRADGPLDGPTDGPTERTQPRWMTGVDNLGLVGAAVLGLLIQPWGVVAAADVAVLRTYDASPARFAGIVAVTVTCTAPYAIASLLAFLRPEQTTRRLAAVRPWFESHQRSMLSALIWFVAAWLILHGLTIMLTA